MSDRSWFQEHLRLDEIWGCDPSTDWWTQFLHYKEFISLMAGATGHAYAQRFLDRMEVGDRVAEHYVFEDQWGAARHYDYLIEMARVDAWMASPEGVAALATTKEQLKQRGTA